MSIIDNVVEKAGNPDAPEVAIMQAPETLTTQTAGGEAEITSLRSHANLADNAEAVKQADAIKGAEVSQTEKQKLEAMLNQMNPDNEGHYKFARYYALTGGRSGGQLFIKGINGRPETISFPKGLYATTEKRIADEIDAGIKRIQNGIGHIVQNISYKHYKEKQDAAAAYSAMLNEQGHGMVSSNGIDAHTIERAAQAKQLQNTVNVQQQRIAELEAKLAAQPNVAPVVNGNNALPQVTESTGKPIPPVASQQATKGSDSLAGLLNGNG